MRCVRVFFCCARMYSGNSARLIKKNKKTATCVNLQLPIVILKKSILLDIYHHKTYMYINFQQNWVNKSVITVHTNLFAKKIASCINLQLPIVFFKNRPFQTCIIVKRTCISIFNKIGLVDQSKLCTQIYLQKFANCINLQLIFRNSNCKLQIYAICKCLQINLCARF